ncbi:3-keto-disaccharide hydrolase [Geofilum rubicundum]|uniref:Probable secreted glycosyl hydrolase n=1 Tax=Geofilum rubicundum JCM 15548 TaxID=1236989 RepID=A0A0E9M1H5_9BACT|nr:DUF1080 domain-containing protein [Geofilum rubicundum]GAO31221.1 probable secreted glycosyl hydrolase [Geofilum rubicundum JCM 15548]
MKIKKVWLLLPVIGAALLVACGPAKPKEAPVNTLSALEEEEGWMLLFDGETFNGWRGYTRDDIPSAWSIDSAAIKINGSGAGEAGAEDGGDIIFDQKFKNFELKFEWKVSKGGNSGVFYLAQELDSFPIWRSSPEYQILDNENHLDARLGVDGNRKSASLYDLIPAKPQNSKPFGEWNTGSIVVYKGTVLHYQNDELVLEYHLWTPEWEQMIADSKFAGWEEFLNAGGAERSGFIGLQDHGDDVWFRNIKLKEME